MITQHVPVTVPLTPADQARQHTGSALMQLATTATDAATRDTIDVRWKVEVMLGDDVWASGVATQYTRSTNLLSVVS